MEIVGFKSRFEWRDGRERSGKKRKAIPREFCAVSGFSFSS